MENEIVVVEKQEIRLGSLEVDPGQMIAVATEKAKALAAVVNDRKLYSDIQGRKYVRVEGWSTLGAMLGILPREVEVKEIDGDVEATVELIRVSDGAVVGRGSAIVGSDEKMWQSRPRYARRSMAITRATGKAYRLGFSWIMSLAGYECTPAEEMEGVIVEKPVNLEVSAEMSLEMAENCKNSKGERYGDLDNKTLTAMLNAMIKKGDKSDEVKFKMDAAKTLLKSRAATTGS